jgi:hypothetical protein
MAEPIEANYVPEGDDWTITVTGRGKKLTAKAPGIIAARDRTDQLVEQLAPDEEHRTVVHLLNGDAVEFTTAYLTARMTTKAEPEPDVTPDPPTEQVAEPDKAAEPERAAEPDKAEETPKQTPRPRQAEADKPAASPSS